ncbi:exonuclease [Stereum hirsutum FP-91666 SS1]|uniref:exonuclease n=1 Tax=Stereum hirsutum (strain FP-91666) TaxID=721885 RepID=UPI0004449D68|nr:exonuclease [Stereum hirsutum FP-91666 SS1]EIM82494.1 exonuclease [Stereum hirsutum FP-91666 SS1]
MLRSTPSLLRSTASVVARRPVRTGRVLVVRKYSQDNVTEVTPVASSSKEPIPNSSRREAWLFVDSVFPITFARWDVRYYWSLFRQDELLSSLKRLLSDAQTHDFRPLSLSPQVKDGGVFVKFEYSGPDGQVESTLRRIEEDLREHVSKNGGIPNSLGVFKRGSLWVVRGSPWREDMYRFASPLLRVIFEGPDVQEEALYNIFRPYGRIVDLSSPSPLPGTSLRSSTISFSKPTSAVIARNVAHGINAGQTRLRTVFQPPVQAHVVRDWITSHPKIMGPVFFFLIGTITYTIFDPIRAFFVEAKVGDWLDYREFKAYQWLRATALTRFSLGDNSSSTTKLEDADAEGSWQTRKDAEVALRNYLNDLPTTVAFVHGPQGSGKSRMLGRVLKDVERSALVIDVSELLKANSDTQMIASLAEQTGYWPVFSFLNDINHLVDLASVGLIGQKAGFSTSLTDQTKNILEITGTALTSLQASNRKSFEEQSKRNTRNKDSAAKGGLVGRVKGWFGATNENVDGAVGKEKLEREVKEKVEETTEKGEEVEKAEGVLEGVRRSGQDVYRVATGIPTGTVSKVREWVGYNSSSESSSEPAKDDKAEEGGSGEASRNEDDVHAVKALPIVVLKNYNAGKRDDVLDVLGQWAAGLVDNQIAHVVVLSDNRENSKRLAKALPSKPLNSIALYDADSASALQFVKQRLHESGIDADFSEKETAYVERLGGRASDLASLIHKVRGGQRVVDAVDDIVRRGVSELRKNAFGDDMEDAKALPWTREQAWAVLKALSGANEVPYHDVLVNFPFKGDEAALRAMEQAELITIGTHNERPSVIRPGKPVYHYVFERLVSDPIFQATQDLAFNTKLVEAAETIVKSCESELIALKEIASFDQGSWNLLAGPSPTKQRATHLLEKMQAAQESVRKLEKRNAELKAVLKKGG